MTREEAIKALKWFKKYKEEDYCGSDRIQDEIGNWYYLISEKDFEAFELAIKVLEQEPTTKNNLAHNLCDSCTNIRCEFQSGIVRTKCAFYMPSVTPQEPRWIPVSERLPENKETVLVTFKHFVSGNTIGLGSVILLRGKPHWHVREQNLGTYDVLAWLPLPEPYREVEE